MGMIEELVEIGKKEVLEEGRRAGVEEATCRFVERLLKDSDLPLEKIASLTGVSLERVRKISVMSIIGQLAEVKRKEVLEECRSRDYCEDYTFRHVRGYMESYKLGLQDGVELVVRGFVESLLRRSAYSVEEVAALAEVSLDVVRKIKEELRHDMRGNDNI